MRDHRSPLNEESEYLEDEIATRETNFDLIGRGQFSLTDKINLTATVGWSSNDRKYNRSSGSVSDFLVNVTKMTTALNTSLEASSFENVKSFQQSNRDMPLNFDVADELPSTSQEQWKPLQP